jgi:hypothetical protein
MPARTSPCHATLRITFSGKWRRPAKSIRDFVARCRSALFGHPCLPMHHAVQPKAAEGYRTRAPAKAYTQQGESPCEAERSPACNRRLLRRGNTGWRAAGDEQPVRNNVT